MSNTPSVSDDISGNDINEAIEESNLKDKDLTDLDESVFSDLEVIGEMSDIDLSLINATASTTKVVETSYCYDRENKNLLVTYTADGEITKYVYGNGLISSYKVKNTTTEYRNYSYDLRGNATGAVVGFAVGVALSVEIDLHEDKNGRTQSDKWKDDIYELYRSKRY